MVCMEEYDDRTYPHNRGRALCQRTQPSAERAAWRRTLSSGLVSCGACLREHARRIESDLDRAVSELWRARAEARRPRIGVGAVVAMVAAARMVRGGWSSRPWARGDGVIHWDFVAPWMTHAAISACGRYRHGDYGFAPDLDDVDCPDCLAIARRAGVLKEVE